MPTEIKFLKSAVLAADYPDTKRPEVAIAGRSNAGKSSFINCLTDSKIAKVSQEPGKTRLLNFFNYGDYYRIVDTPGYGYASRPGEEVLSWREMLETYFSSRDNFVGLVLLMDVKREWEEDEEIMVNYLHSIDKPVLVALTKTDRCTRNEIEARKKAIAYASGLNEIWTISSQTNKGVHDLEDFYFKNWVKPYLGGKKPK